MVVDAMKMSQRLPVSEYDAQAQYPTISIFFFLVRRFVVFYHQTQICRPCFQDAGTRGLPQAIILSFATHDWDAVLQRYVDYPVRRALTGVGG